MIGTRLFTQEQRAEDEVVVCYDADTGAELWVHADATRFTEVVGGAGPRATPTYHEGNLYTLGANGMLNCLDPVSGMPRWSRNIVVDSGRDQLPASEKRPRIPQWGFSSSPLVAQGIVTVFAGGPGGKSMLGYRAASGELAWAAGEGEVELLLAPTFTPGRRRTNLDRHRRGDDCFHPLRGEVVSAWTPMEDLAKESSAGHPE